MRLELPAPIGVVENKLDPGNGERSEGRPEAVKHYHSMWPACSSVRWKAIRLDCQARHHAKVGIDAVGEHAMGNSMRKLTAGMAGR